MFNKRNELNSKGITLIALVVTIVVLLILAGTTYNLIIGNDGIFRKSKTGTEIYENAAMNEQKDLNSVTNLIDKYMVEK